jgi:hypothetical protein
VEDAVQAALRSGSEEHLRVLGHGEISLVIGWPSDEPVVACKRLPTFPSADAAERYAEVFGRYLARVTAGGVNVVPSTFHVLPTAGGATRVAYVVQPVLPNGSLGPDVLRAAAPDPEHPLLAAVVAGVLGVVDERTGLDAQISNWALFGGDAHYLDVTTPILYDDGELALDIGILIAAYPWMLRAALRRFVAPPIAAAYCDRRTVLLDLAANLHKENLTEWMSAVLQAVNRTVSPPITAEEVRRYYRGNARLWEVMLRLRRLDRRWQRQVRRRAYPYLLPGPVAR